MKQSKIILKDNSVAILTDTDKYKTLRSENYNFTFNKETGFFARWGKTVDDNGDPNIAMIEIADIEISTSCHGIGIPCSFCYKSNTPNGEYMTFETFKKIFSKLPPTLTQIAVGIGDIDSNPDIWKIFEYCKSNGIIPNITINGYNMNESDFDNLTKYCGAVAVSYYNKDLTYNAIKKLTDRGMNQINIHFLISENTINDAYNVMYDMQNDMKLSKMNAIVFLSLKKMGNAKSGYTQLNQEKFNNLCKYAITNNIRFGFDSCSAQLFLKAVKDHPNYKLMEQCAETCESTLYSMYIDVKGNFYPCSFSPDTEGWNTGISVLNCNNFIEDIWLHDRTKNFSEGVIKCRNCKQSCSIYNLD
jgi:MoaA/NifB/PqqE/SkfB family radical SAM enzyme